MPNPRNKCTLAEILEQYDELVAKMYYHNLPHYTAVQK